MSFANQQTAIQPNYSAIRSAQLPVLGGQQMGPQQIQPQTKDMNEAQSREYSDRKAAMLGAR
jgi:hypothetical protein